ncbi:hypothetical protein ACTU44_11215 [Thalassospira sp. SM2505]
MQKPTCRITRLVGTAPDEGLKIEFEIIDPSIGLHEPPLIDEQTFSDLLAVIEPDALAALNNHMPPLNHNEYKRLFQQHKAQFAEIILEKTLNKISSKHAFQSWKGVRIKVEDIRPLL